MVDFFNNSLDVGDIVLTSFVNGWGDQDLFEYCRIERFTQKAVIVNRLQLKRKKESRRVLAHHLIKVDPAHYTMYVLKKQKDTV